MELIVNYFAIINYQKKYDSMIRSMIGLFHSEVGMCEPMTNNQERTF